jgi:hypothetical protein
MRVCGTCRLCCKVFPLPVLHKPWDEWCKFACSAGCSIHGEKMPAVCREYTCYWLDHEEMPDEYRPDRIGIVVTESGVITVGDETLGVLLLNQSHPEASLRRRAQALIAQVVAWGMVAMILHGPNMRIVYDRARYASITPRDIEVAFRHAQSQDAEELKRLGAVSDDYRPLTREEADALTSEGFEAH